MDTNTTVSTTVSGDDVDVIVSEISSTDAAEVAAVVEASGKFKFADLFSDKRVVLRDMVLDFCGRNDRRITPMDIVETMIDDSDLPIQDHLGSQDGKSKRQRTHEEARAYLNGKRADTVQACFLFGLMDTDEIKFNLVGGAKGGIGLVNPSSNPNSAPSQFVSRLKEYLDNVCVPGKFVTITTIAKELGADILTLDKMRKEISEALKSDTYLAETYSTAKGSGSGVALKSTIEEAEKKRADKVKSKKTDAQPAPDAQASV